MLSMAVAAPLIAVQAITMIPTGLFAQFMLGEQIEAVINRAVNQIVGAIAEKKGVLKTLEEGLSSLGTPGDGLPQESKTAVCEG